MHIGERVVIDFESGDRRSGETVGSNIEVDPVGVAWATFTIVCKLEEGSPKTLNDKIKALEKRIKQLEVKHAVCR